MSWSTLVIGYFSFKKDKTYDEVKEAIKMICKYSEVDVPTRIMKRSNYYKNIHHLPNGAHIIADDNTNNGIELIINDINFSSHINIDTVNTIKYIVAKYNNILHFASFELYDLDDPIDYFEWDQSTSKDVIDEYLQYAINLDNEDKEVWKDADWTPFKNADWPKQSIV